ncbi:LuxR family transcriptional regulator [Kitasatospora cinereorecta]
MAVRVAALEALRRLAARGPVLVLLDDTQWLDEASRQVIAFAARRLADRRIRFVVTERTDHDPVMAELCPRPVTELPVGPLAERAVGALLRDRLGLRLAGLTLARIHAVSAGNAYFALELGRELRARGEHAALAADPGRPLGVPQRLRHLVAARLTALPADARRALAVLAAARPGTRLPEQLTGPLGAAVEQGVLVHGPGGALQFAHPLLAELVAAAAAPAARREAHRLLAGLTADPVERARHRALAAEHPDPAIAAELDRAADTALTRGAPGTAADQLRLAAEHTGDDPDAAARRLLAAARNAATAGLPDLARACGERLSAAPGRDVRVQAALLLVRLLGLDHPESGALLAAAAAEAEGVPALAAAVRQERAVRALHHADHTAGLAELAAAEREAAAADDPDLLVEVLAVRAPIELSSDPAHGLALLERGRRLSAGRPLTGAAVFVRQGLAVAHLRTGAVGRALAEVDALRAEVERAGRTEDLCTVLYVAASVYERAGRCAESYAFGRAAYELRERIEPAPGPARVLGGAAELNAGTVERAADLLDAAILAAASDQDREWLAYAHGLRGRVDLLRGTPAAAVGHFRQARQLLRRLQFDDPALFLLDADLAEALALTGEGGAAAEAIADGRERARRLGREVVLLGLDRAEAVLAAVDGDPRSAADALRATIPERHPYPLEIARARLALGRLERRARRRAAARSELREAADRYARAGCTPWLRHTEAALAELDPAEPDPTPVQRDILGLVRGGATNREIAASLHLSVKAVEANLTRLYRQFGVRGRGELVRAADPAARQGGDQCALRTIRTSAPTGR